MVLVYSRSSCAPCATLKYWLTKKNIAYKELPETDIPASMVAEGVVLPLVVINETVIKGLNFQAVEKALA